MSYVDSLFGAFVAGDGVHFRVWAPKVRGLRLCIEGHSDSIAMRQTSEGIFEADAPGLTAGALYKYELDDGSRFPDPASRFQPQGVHGPSQVVDLNRYHWRDSKWRGIPQGKMVFYEAHVGAFTSEGTFRALQSKLPYLRDLGINCLELLPIGEFPGQRNWGYDPAAMYAPFHGYGSPDDLMRLIDQAHEEGIAVFLDVIYNHFGPEGAYATAFGDYQTPKHRSNWGDGINLDGPGRDKVRAFFIDNALQWLRDYHFDGLRLDATDTLVDDSPQHFLAELSEAVEQLPGPPRYLIAEDHRNLATIVTPREQGGYGLHGVWADDFHHQVRNLCTGENEAHFVDFDPTSAADLGTTLRQGWFYNGKYSKSKRRVKGTSTEGLLQERFVICIQNHDQVGNRPKGERLHHEISLSLYRAMSALLLFAPQTPLLFMGQEWAASTPFMFFTDHPAELGKLVFEGRRQEFRDFSGYAADIADPQELSTFERSKLIWEELTYSKHLQTFKFYQHLLRLRAELEGPLEVISATERSLALRRGKHLLVVAMAKDQVVDALPPHTKLLDTDLYATDDESNSINASPTRVSFSSAGAYVGLITCPHQDDFPSTHRRRELEAQLPTGGQNAQTH